MKLTNYYDLHFNSDKHLDLGCGYRIKNPYNSLTLYGLDIHGNKENLIKNYKKANLILDKIPFPDNFFSSLSAYDFLEHIPRQLFIDGKMQYPFINLMSEIFRVLKPNGLFFACTPVYPHPDSFVDPAHVNYITDSTHNYFINDNILGIHYGFKGNFKEKKVLKIKPKLMEKDFRNKFIMYFQWYNRKFKGQFSHLIWELEAVKNNYI